MKTGLLDILKESINEGGVKKDLYTNLKLSKRNEFYEEDDLTQIPLSPQERYDREVAERRAKNDKLFEKKIRHYFTYLQRIGGMEEVKNSLETYPDATRNLQAYKDAICSSCNNSVKT